MNMESLIMRMLGIMEKYIYGIKHGEKEFDRFSKLKRVPNIYHAVLNNMMLGSKDILPPTNATDCFIAVQFSQSYKPFNPAYLQANLLLVGVWRVKLTDRDA